MLGTEPGGRNPLSHCCSPKYNNTLNSIGTYNHFWLSKATTYVATKLLRWFMYCISFNVFKKKNYNKIYLDELFFKQTYLSKITFFKII